MTRICRAGVAVIAGCTIKHRVIDTTPACRERRDVGLIAARVETRQTVQLLATILNTLTVVPAVGVVTTLDWTLRGANSRQEILRETDVPVGNTELEAISGQTFRRASEFLALPAVAGLILRTVGILLTTVRVAWFKTDNTTTTDVTG